MPLDKTILNTNRGTTGLIPLPPEISQEIWSNTLQNSAIMQLARRIQLPASGASIPVITGDPTADWVSETAEKPVSSPSFSSKEIQPYKMAVIEMFSNEFRRDYAALYDQLVARLPYALAKKFDRTVFGVDSKPGDKFDQLNAAPTVDIQKDSWKGLVDARAKVAAADGVLTGFAIAPQAESLLLTQTDTTGRPLFVNSVTTDGAITRLAGVPVYHSRGVYKDKTATAPAVLGYGGDWTSAIWGTVEDIQFKISDQATINDGTRQINLFQRNMFAVMVEFEVGFVVGDVNKFVQLTETGGKA